jgi:hypothetical protein
MYADRTRDIQPPNLAHLFRVSAPVIHKVLDNTYVPLEDYEDMRKRKPELIRRERPLPSVHHINGNYFDNRKENPRIDESSVDDPRLPEKNGEEKSRGRKPVQHPE